MKKYVKIGLAVIVLLSLVFISIGKEKTAFLEMVVKGLSLDSTGNSPVVVLMDKEGEKFLPIWIGPLEANAIDKELKHLPSARPMTHDLFYSILGQVHVKVKEVKIVELKNQTYFATLSLMLNKDLIEVDARPSDAIILALKSKAPIFVSARILEEQGMVFRKKEDRGERYGIRIQELTPSLASHFNFKGQKGVLVSEVIPGSASEFSEIKAGDIITKINSKEMGSIKEFEDFLDAVKDAGSHRILLFRDEKVHEINWVLKPKP